MNISVVPLICVILFVSVYSRTTERYTKSSPSLKRSIESIEDYEEIPESEETTFDDEYSEEDSSLRDRRSIKQKSARLNLKPRLDCGQGNDENTRAPWSLDTGKVPENLKEGSYNDGLLGVPGGPQAPNLGGGTQNIPWREVFNSAPISDDGNQGGFDNTGDSSFGNSDQGDSSFGNVDQEDSSFGNSDQGDSSFGDSDQGDSSFGDSDQGDSSFGDSDQGGSSFGNNGQDGSPVEDSEPLRPCTCMSILKCGATFRSTASESGENTCAHDGEVCCEIEQTVPPPTAQPPGLQCGQSRPQPDVKAGFLTDTSALFGEAPWTVLLSTKEVDEEANGRWTYRCAGTLIHPQVVLTAAHCVKDENIVNLIVRAGDWDLSREGSEPLPFQERGVQTITVHPLFRSDFPPNDAAVLFLTEPFNMADNVNTICLPTNHDDVDISKCVATGWGKDTKREELDVMKKVEMPIIARDACQRALRLTRLGRYFKLDKSFLCAGGEAEKDVCEGDGGGPLTCPHKSSGAMMQVGITSWGIDCGRLGVPGVFVDVAKMSDWINTQLELLVKNSF